jgi:multidrug efflux system membrane fusion protein
METISSRLKNGVKKNPRYLLAALISLGSTALAVAALSYVFYLYYFYPRTYDAYVRANTISMSPHVSGWIMELPIVDNQYVKKGSVLFTVDERPYAAKLARREANLAYSRQYLERVQKLLPKRFVTPNDVIRARTQVQADEAMVDLAKLDVHYCKVRAPFNGYVTNLNISLHEYANEGRPVLTLVDDSAWYVLANYREEFLRFIKPGMAVKVYVQSYPHQAFRGHVEGLAWGIHVPGDRPPANLVPNISPTLNWVILSQRFPVRVIIDERHPNKPLRMGQTAVVTIDGYHKS